MQESSSMHWVAWKSQTSQLQEVENVLTLHNFDRRISILYTPTHNSTSCIIVSKFIRSMRISSVNIKVDRITTLYTYIWYQFWKMQVRKPCLAQMELYNKKGMDKNWGEEKYSPSIRNYMHCIACSGFNLPLYISLISLCCVHAH